MRLKISGDDGALVVVVVVREQEGVLGLNPRYEVVDSAQAGARDGGLA